jgi:hypothetical protein
VSETIKIPVEPEVKFDPSVFASFQNAAVRAASNVVAATNRASKAQQTLGFNIQTTGLHATKAAAQVVAAQQAMTGATQQQTARRIAAIQQQITAIQQLTEATKGLNQAAGSAPQINVIRPGRGGSGGSITTPPTNQLMAGNQISGAISRGTNNVLGIGREIGRGMGIDMDVSNSMQRNISINREATQLAIQGQATDVPGTAKNIESEARRIALATGANVEDIVKALRSFHAYTGDLKGGMDQLGNMAQSSVAYDTDIKDIASLYAVITKYMGKEGTKEGVDALVRTIATQGREGAVEVRDQIKQDPKILVGASQFGVTDSTLKAFGGDKRAAQAGVALGLQQAIMGVSGESANQSGNAVKSFMDTLSQKNTQEGMKKHGIDLFTQDKETGKKVYKPLEEIIPMMAAKMQEDPTFLREMMGNVRGRKVVQAFSSKGMQAYDDSLKGGNSKEEAEKAAATVVLQDIRDVGLKFQSALDRTGDVNNFLASEAGKTAQMQAEVREMLDQATKGIVTSIHDHRTQVDSAVKTFGSAISLAAEYPKSAAALAFSVPMLQQVLANAAAGALPSVFAAAAPALAAAAAGIAPALVVAAVGASIIALVGAYDKGTVEDPQGADGGSNQGDVEAKAEQRAKDLAHENGWQDRFTAKPPTPESEGFTSNPQAPAGVTIDIKYEKIKQAMSDALRENQPQMPFPNSPLRQDGVSIELPGLAQ